MPAQLTVIESTSYRNLSALDLDTGPLMHLLLDMVPLSLPPESAALLSPEDRARAVSLFTLYSAEKPSLARSALKAAQVFTYDPLQLANPRTCPTRFSCFV